MQIMLLALHPRCRNNNAGLRTKNGGQSGIYGNSLRFMQSVGELGFWAPKKWGLTAERLKESESRMIVVARGMVK